MLHYFRSLLPLKMQWHRLPIYQEKVAKCITNLYFTSRTWDDGKHFIRLVAKLQAYYLRSYTVVI